MEWELPLVPHLIFWFIVLSPIDRMIQPSSIRWRWSQTYSLAWTWLPTRTPKRVKIGNRYQLLDLQMGISNHRKAEDSRLARSIEFSVAALLIVFGDVFSPAVPPSPQGARLQVSKSAVTLNLNLGKMRCFLASTVARAASQLFAKVPAGSLNERVADSKDAVFVGAQVMAVFNFYDRFVSAKGVKPVSGDAFCRFGRRLAEHG